MNEIKEHMRVVGDDGGHVGIVDCLEGNRIKLTKESEGHHRYIEMKLVASVESDSVKLSMDAASARDMCKLL